MTPSDLDTIKMVREALFCMIGFYQNVDVPLAALDALIARIEGDGG